ncbi:MAG: Gfo/Idh/MocA family oxidoreductase, partial [Alphaproteobacteria bacterium]|nr:Gfo/Idh/MocA family oxidoreductase [Alphaproteobacteria bacterium]
MLDVAIVGLGRWGQQLVEAVHGRSDALRFTRAVVRSLDSARAAAARFGLAATTDYDAVLADPSIKGVVLATPHSQHAAQVQRAAAAGKAVFCEKPFTLTHAEARAAASACAGAGVPLCLGFNRRFLASYRELQRRAAGGELGVLLHVEAFFGSNGGYRYTAGMWRASEAESPAGGMTGLGVHLLDAMIGLCGPVAAVRADSRKRGLIPIDDTTTAWLEFASGATGSLVTLPASAPGWHLRLSGGKGRG